MWAFFIVFALLNAAVIGRIYLVGINKKTAADLSYSGFSLTIEHKRGTIFDRNGRPLTNDKTQTVAVFTPQTLSDDRINMYLTETQINQLISLCRSLEGLDADQLKSRVEEVQNTLNKVSTAKTQVVGFVQSVKKVVTSVQSFFERIKNIIGM